MKYAEIFRDAKEATRVLGNFIKKHNVKYGKKQRECMTIHTEMMQNLVWLYVRQANKSIYKG